MAARVVARNWKTGISWLRAIQKATDLFARKRGTVTYGLRASKGQQTCLHVTEKTGTYGLRADRGGGLLFARKGETGIIWLRANQKPGA